MGEQSIKKQKEPLVHITRRTSISWWKSLLIRLAAIAVGFLVSGLLMLAITGKNPIDVYVSMYKGSFGTKGKIWVMLQNLFLLLGVAVAVTPAFKMKFWNIGAEGQVLVGVLSSALCAYYVKDSIPEPLLLVVMLLASIVSGAVWAVIPGLFKAKFNTNETLFTLMMNYIAIQLVSFAIKSIVTSGSGVFPLLNDGHLPRIYNQYLFNIIIIAVITVFMFIYLKYMKHGYEIAVVGESHNTARYIGINVPKVIIRTTLLSGAICGIIGFILIAGVGNNLSTTVVQGRGFTAIIVSWMAKFNPLIMVLTSFLVVFIQRGMAQVSMDFRITSDALQSIITGLIFFFIIGCEFFINYKINFRSSGKKEAKKQ
ncbi:MAG: ABC transporter permease [Clostridia bacterium]|nr:ABC transporter permease [Clostridia bacterium]